MMIAITTKRYGGVTIALYHGDGGDVGTGVAGAAVGSVEGSALGAPLVSSVDGVVTTVVGCAGGIAALKTAAGIRSMHA